MFPVGSYDRFVSIVKRRENPDISSTFGVLFAKPTDPRVKNYIVDYLPDFHNHSGKKINFYIPGYIDETLLNKNERNESLVSVHVDNTNYVFSENYYREFYLSFSDDFNVSIPYSPTLILFEYSNGNFKNTEKLFFDLSSKPHIIEHTGYFFDQIFKIAEEKVAIRDFRNKLFLNEIKEYFKDEATKDSGLPYISILPEIGAKIYKFYIK